MNRVARLYDRGEIRLDRTDERSLNYREVRIDVAYAGICGSDVHEYANGPVAYRPHDETYSVPESEWDDLLPKPMGHEIAGTVSEVGDGVTRVAEGDTVTVRNRIPCDDCRYCEQGKSHLCAASDGDVLKIPGFADQMIIPEGSAVPVPREISLRQAALTEPLSVSVHAVHRSQLQIGDTVAIFGAGTIGLGIVNAANAAGAARILVSEPETTRREAAAELGADVTLDPTDDDVVERIEQLTNGGADVVFECAGLDTTFQQALRSAKYDGTIVVLSVFKNEVSVHPNTIVQTERTIRGSFAYCGDYETTLQMIQEGRLSPETIVSDVVEMSKIETAFERLTNTACSDIKILVEP